MALGGAGLAVTDCIITISASADLPRECIIGRGDARSTLSGPSSADGVQEVLEALPRITSGTAMIATAEPKGRRRPRKSAGPGTTPRVATIVRRNATRTGTSRVTRSGRSRKIASRRKKRTTPPSSIGRKAIWPGSGPSLLIGPGDKREVFHRPAAARRHVCQPGCFVFGGATDFADGILRRTGCLEWPRPAKPPCRYRPHVERDSEPRPRPSRPSWALGMVASGAALDRPVRVHRACGPADCGRRDLGLCRTGRRSWRGGHGPLR